MNWNLDSWLTPEEMDRIHNDSLDILWERGMHITHPRALELLQAYGAKMNPETNMVFFPPELVERCLNTMPASFLMADRMCNRELHIGSGSRPFVRCTSGAEGYIDLRQRTHRLGTSQDLQEWSRLVDALEHIDICGGFYPEDGPADCRDVLAVKIMFENCLKPVFLNPYDVETTGAILNMALAIRGSEQALRERPLFSVLTSATAPGHILDYCVDILFLTGRQGIPVEVNTAPIMGATCPVTIAGCLLQSNVEILSLITISQLANPGTPLLHRVITMIMDMSSGAGVIASMESALAQAALAQLMKNKYRMPVATYGPITDSKLCDGQSQIERTILTLLATMTGCDLLLAPGFIEALNTVDPVQLVIDDEILGLVLRLQQGFEVNEETLAKDCIMRVGPGSNFLAEQHTFEHFRREQVRPKIFNRDNRSGWEGKGAKDLNQQAAERAGRLLKTREPELLDPKIQQELDTIFRSLQKDKTN